MDIPDLGQLPANLRAFAEARDGAGGREQLLVRRLDSAKEGPSRQLIMQHSVQWIRQAILWRSFNVVDLPDRLDQKSHQQL